MDDNQVKDGVGFETLNFVLFYIVTLNIYIFQALLYEHECSLSSYCFFILLQLMSY